MLGPMTAEPPNDTSPEIERSLIVRVGRAQHQHTFYEGS